MHLLVLPLLLILSSDALAEEVTADDFSASVTYSPVHMAVGLVDLDGEYKVNNKLGVGLRGGFGLMDEAGHTLVGTHADYYALGDFKSGMPLTLQAQYMTDQATAADGLVASSRIWSVGALLGYKRIFDLGLTTSISVGFGHIAGRFTLTEDGVSESENRSRGQIMSNLRVGWSL